MEGVLTPEIWVNVAERTGVQELRLTTRDLPDYNELMRTRLRLLGEHGLGIDDIRRVIADLAPLPGAREFLDWVRQNMQLAVLSDTFYDFAQPFMAQLGWPMLLCHKLSIDASGRITDFHIRQPDPKRQAVKAFHQLRYRVMAAGDSFNDTGMLDEADAGFLLHAPASISEQLSQYPSCDSYDSLREQLAAQL